MSRRKRWWAAGYLLLLVLSHAVRWLEPELEPLALGDEALLVREVSGGRLLERQIRLVYDRAGLAGPAADASPVLLIHGSPGEKESFSSLEPSLTATGRPWIAVDLPGFGHSERDISDYSIRAHALYCRQLLEELEVRRAHVLGVGLGGGVALELAGLAPDHLASLALVSSIGVQEYELLGDYDLNHLLHGLQLGGLWLAREGVPHFGYFDDADLGVPFARSFFDTDQRPLRGLLSSLQLPVLIFHSPDDLLVPIATAEESHRLVPQSELVVVQGNHLLSLAAVSAVVERLEEFFGRVDRGEATTRETASAERRAAAAIVSDPRGSRPFTGFAFGVVVAGLALATLVSEDLACIGAGLLVSAGRLGYFPGFIACLIGIFIGDILLYAAGRVFGREALRHRPLRWWLRPDAIAASQRWFERRGPVIVLLTRFIPGSRLPTYFVAGLLRTRFWRFAAYLLLAAALWAPLLVGLTSWFGSSVRDLLGRFERHSWWVVPMVGAWIFFAVRVLLPAFTWRGRRLLRGRVRRWLRWEYWPPWLFYPPVIGWVVWLGWRHRSFTLFTACNPAMPAGGFVGESKSAILAGLGHAGGLVARHRTIRMSSTPEERIGEARTFLAEYQLGFPVVSKPDVGQRGAGVKIVASEDALASHLAEIPGDVILQEYVTGREFGVFYLRLPDDPSGRLFSLTEKRLPEVVGDGRRSLEELILAEDALLAMAPLYLESHADDLSRVLAPGEPRRLVELGTHCRGAVFLDGSWVHSPELEAAFDRVGRGFEGFYFGRFDVRAPDLEAFRAGCHFKILELNGVTSEATHIYDPASSLFDGYQVLFRQWQLAFEIGRQNVARGVAQPVTVRQLLASALHFWRGRNSGTTSRHQI